jgi:hypothetical protein
MSEPLPLPDLEPVQSIPAPKYDYFLAVVHNNVVYQTLNVDGQTAALYTSSPQFIQIARNEAQVGYTYDPATGTFSDS